MSSLSPLLTLIDVYAEATGSAESTISTRIFNDGKKIHVLRSGGDITTSRLDGAIQWLSAHWPENAVWPAGVPRPFLRKEGDAA